MKSLIIFCLALTGCATVAPSKYPLPTDPVPVLVDTELSAWVNAQEFAAVEGGDVYRVFPTGSMEPTLKGGDYVVVNDALPWADYVPYKITLYDAEWSLADVIHRIVGRDSGGLILSGDANQYSESQYRVTEARAKGLLVGIWRVQN